MEVIMESQPDRDAIAEEAVGQRHGGAPPDAAKKADMSQEEIARWLATPSGPQASIPEKTAESVGERVADAYSDPESVAQKPKENLSRPTATQLGPRVFSVGRKAAQGVPRQFYERRFVTVVAGFALGYMTAL